MLLRVFLTVFNTNFQNYADQVEKLIVQVRDKFLITAKQFITFNENNCRIFKNGQKLLCFSKLSHDLLKFKKKFRVKEFFFKKFEAGDLLSDVLIFSF